MVDGELRHVPALIDTVAKPPRRPRATRRLSCDHEDVAAVAMPGLPHETCRLSCGHVEGVEALWHHIDAIDAT